MSVVRCPACGAADLIRNSSDLTCPSCRASFRRHLRWVPFLATSVVLCAVVAAAGALLVNGGIVRFLVGPLCVAIWLLSRNFRELQRA
jgi:hypothetical protein